MDGVLHADDAKLAQGALNQVVGGDGGAVASNLSRKNSSEVGPPTLLSGVMYQTFSGHYTNVMVGNVAYSKINFSPGQLILQQPKINFCPRYMVICSN